MKDLLIYLTGVFFIFLFFKWLSKWRDGKKLNSDKSLKKWWFECQRFVFDVDFDNETIRLQVPKPLRFLKGGKAMPRGRVDLTLSLLAFEFSSFELKEEDEYVPNVSTGMTSDGKLITVTGSGGRMYAAPTGKSCLTFKHRIEEVSENGERHYLRQCDSEAIEIDFYKQRNAEVMAFLERLRRVEKQIKALVESRGSQLLAESKARKQAQQAAERIQAEKDKEAKRIRDEKAQKAFEQRFWQMIGASEMTNDFCDHHRDAGSEFPSWLISQNRDGKTLVAWASESWVGHVRSMTWSRLDPIGNEQRSALELVLGDPAYEREHLKKRRVQVLVNRQKAVLDEWVDRLEILKSLSQPVP